MRLNFGQLESTSYCQRSLGGDAIKHESMIQIRRSGEIELVIAITCEPGSEQLLQDALEFGPGSAPISARKVGKPVDRISKGWSAWPGDARADVPTRMVILWASIPAGVDEITLQLPSLGEPQIIDLSGVEDLPVETVVDNFSLAKGTIGDATFTRISYYTDGDTWPPPFFVDTPGEFGGAKLESFDGYIDAQLVTWKPMNSFLSVAIEFHDS